MLALVVEPVKGMKKVVPSFVRLERFNSGSVGLRKTSELLLGPLIPEDFFGVGYNEVSVRGFYGPVVFCEGDRKVVEAVTLGLDDHADGSLDVSGDHFSENDIKESTAIDKVDLGLVGFPGRVGLRLLPNSVGLVFDKGANISIKNPSLGICPI
jgi:hypothetical protein